MALKKLRMICAGGDKTLAEWDKKGSAAGRICGLIEESHIAHPPEKRHKS